MHPCPENWVAIRHAVVYYVFSAAIKCRHCITVFDNIKGILNAIALSVCYQTYHSGIIFIFCVSALDSSPNDSIIIDYDNPTS